MSSSGEKHVKFINEIDVGQVTCWARNMSSLSTR